MTRRRWAKLAALCLACALTLPLVVQASPQDDEVIIAILDTGIDPNHPEFTGCDQDPLRAYKSFVGGSAQASPAVRDHGTSVASVAIGKTLGEAPCTPILVGQVCDSDGCASTDISQAITWAIDQGADIINLSLGTAQPTPELLFSIEDALADAREAGILVTVAAGNGVGGVGLVPFPSSLGQPSGSHLAFIVGSADEDGDPALTHNWDPEATQAGVSVRVATSLGDAAYTRKSGTSFAAPNAAGIAAVVLQAYLAEHGQHPSPDRLEEILTWTARDDPLIPPSLEGWGFLDKQAAVKAVETGGAQRSPCQTAPVGTLAWASACMNEDHDRASDTLRERW